MRFRSLGCVGQLHQAGLALGAFPYRDEAAEALVLEVTVAPLFKAAGSCWLSGTLWP